ncbi:MAG: hypothetical protein R3186_00645, partial [Ruegeria sp.]|nr:hypothetical protein [Ruegeria sp.]
IELLLINGAECEPWLSCDQALMTERAGEVIAGIRILQHIVLGSITALFLGVILFVITTLDRPLRGEAALPPEPFETLWTRAMIWDEPEGERF